MPASLPAAPIRISNGSRLPDLPLPPGSMPLFYAGRLLKRWRYLGVWSAAHSLCLGDVRVGPFRQQFWAVWDRRRRRLLEHTYLCPGRVTFSPGRALARDGAIRIDLSFTEEPGVQVLTPDARAYTWTKKQLLPVTGSLVLTNGFYEVDAPGLIDDSAGYHPRHTRWQWAAGTGTDITGRRIGWNLVCGVHDGPHDSERTLWIDGEPVEVPPVRFSDDLSTVTFADGAVLHFRAEATRTRKDNLLLVRSSYRQPFGTFSGTLPGGITLAEGFGVTELHDAHW